jgi:hypothetical protein
VSGAVCCVCGKRITDRFWCCEHCAREHGLNGLATWPEWAKFLQCDEKRRRQRRDARVQVIALSDLSTEVAGELERQWYGERED